MNKPIAIVGSSCRFSGGVNSPTKLWELLRNPVDIRTKIPTESRFNPEAFFHPDSTYHGHSNVRHGYVLSPEQQHPGAFDARFFGVKPVEAKALDPQQRLLLETVYEGLEAAGLPLEAMRGTQTGVYVGVMSNDYEAIQQRDLQALPTYHTVGTQRSILANRISYFFDWHGPSMAVDTACSSSLVAVHMAVQALRDSERDSSSIQGLSTMRTAVACGSNLLLGPEQFIGYSSLKMLSQDGTCRMWDAGANGYARGEGVACLVLKTLCAALEDGDSIECVIRETGVNQDGATRGITMPSPAAQADLIRDTYARARLNIASVRDRCQYFEAHGTGTQAGDLVEAEAITSAFFRDEAAGGALSREPVAGEDDRLTVLGHTEGTAGIAAILKASLALQNAWIPPNLHFDTPNPALAPFLQHLEVVTGEGRPWPKMKDGQPRRASVNSFGFGGTNCHVILEHYDMTSTIVREEKENSSREPPIFSPFVFSAATESALASSLAAYSDLIQSSQSLNARDLNGTLRSRRSRFPYRATFPSSSIQELKINIDSALAETAKAGVVSLGNKCTSATGGVLGIFTGQGAQYARMGAELIERSPFVDKIVRDLEGHLSQMPEAQDRPEWSLRSELLADETASRVHEAALAQPMCTAVQIILVDLLRVAGLRFSTVVGHSSGEIAAAYAAGYLSARDAMMVSYYRGLCCERMQRDLQKRGAMLAASLSVQHASSICSQPRFRGRVYVAAHNSASSVTFSGDEDAIAEVENVLAGEQAFKRRLRVDMAYHSHHMKVCKEPYIQALKKCGIQAQQPEDGCVWISSVREDATLPPVDELSGGEYWVENMVRPVLFYEAVTRAASSMTGDDNVALEVGPHPALKGPATQTIKEVLGGTVFPYGGTLSRNITAVESLSRSLGFLWSQLAGGSARPAVNLDLFEKAISGVQGFRMLKNLPIYPWNHERVYWHESRISRSIRHSKTPVHELLGHESPDSSAHHFRFWRHRLKVSEMPWISCHRLQYEIVFPAAGYLVTALEVAKSLEDKASVHMIEVRGFEILHPIILDEDDDSGVEVLVALNNIRRTTKLAEASFTYFAALGKDPESLTMVAKAVVEVSFSEQTAGPTQPSALPNMIEVDSNRFYSSLAEVGYKYSGPFRALSGLSRKLDYASGKVMMVNNNNNGDIDNHGLLIHPAKMDAVIHSLLLAQSYPGDGQLRTLRLPKSIERVRVVTPPLCGPAGLADSSKSQAVPFEAIVDRASVTNSSQIVGDVTVFGPEEPHKAFIRLEGLRLVPLAPATQSDDIKLFSRTVWVNMQPDGEQAALEDEILPEQLELSSLLERISTFYLRRLTTSCPRTIQRGYTGPCGIYLSYARHVNDLNSRGALPRLKPEWFRDTLQDILDASEKYADTPDVKIMHTIGKQMPRVFAGETTILEHIRPNGLLEIYYRNALGLPQTSRWVAKIVGQLTHRYPRMNIFEVGTGTGAATRSILDTIDDDFTSYTFTDITTGFFEPVRAAFATPPPHNNSSNRSKNNMMLFKTFNAERDPVEQGFEPYSYDLVVASFVLHATSALENTLHNIRRLLRPGGFCVVAEFNGTANSTVNPFIFGTLPGWWAGVGEGRVLSPCVPLEKWDALLRGSGFSGVDTATPADRFADVHPFCVLVSQAVDERVELLRQPLSLAPAASCSSHSSPSSAPITANRVITKLVIIGGTTLKVTRLVADLRAILGIFAASVSVFKALSDVDEETLDSEETTVLSLTKLDQPLFQDLSSADFNKLRILVRSRKTLLWASSDRRAGNPFSNALAGFMRTAVCEVPELRVQMLDIEGIATLGKSGKSVRTDAWFLAEAVVRFQRLSSWANDRSKTNGLLWSLETEIVLDSSGRTLVPRVAAMQAADERYNSAIRQITKPLTLEEQPVALVSEGESFFLSSVPGPVQAEESDLIQLETQQSTLLPVKTRLGYRFIMLGQHAVSKENYIFLSCSSVSTAHFPRKEIIPCNDLARTATEGAQLLGLVTLNMLASIILAFFLEGQTVILHKASSALARSVAQAAAERNIHVVYTTDTELDTGISFPKPPLALAAYLSRRELQNVLPRDIAGFVGMEQAGDKIQEAVISCLPSSCHVETAERLLGCICSTTIPAGPDPGATDLIVNELRSAVEYARIAGSTWTDFAADVPLMPIINLGKLITSDVPDEPLEPRQPLSIVEWSQTSNPFPVRVSRLDSNKALFNPERTYWLVGLSGTLGLSLCDWMIDHGAKYLVVTSRNPNVDPAWLQMANNRGARVEVLPGDITSFESLRNVHKIILSTLPPLAGVAQGAMVLQDTPIRDMTLASLDAVLRPKVQGSLNLVDLVCPETATTDANCSGELDFFVFFSSILEVTGNMGQAGYTAANAFMSSLVAQLRRRDVPASVIRIGVVLGAGYVTRELGAAQETALQRAGLTWLSERDFHHIFAEGIQAARYGSRSRQHTEEGEDACNTGEFEVQVGLREMSQDATYLPTWFKDPKFARFAARARDLGVVSSGTGEILNNASLREKLRSVQFLEGAEIMIKESFTSKVRAVLQMEIEDDALVGMRTYEIGLDSLIAVDIRSWILENLKLDVTVLKLLGGVSLASLVADAVQALIPDDIPNLSSNKNAETATSTSAPTDTNTTTTDESRLAEGSGPKYATGSQTSDLESPPDDVPMQHKLPPVKRLLPLSFSQSLFWVVQSMMEDKSTLNHTVLYHLTGQVRINDLRNAVALVGRRHEALRTCFVVQGENNKIMQGVLEEPTLELEHKTVTGGRQDVQKEYELLKQQVFDLAIGQLARVILLSSPDPTDSYLLVGFHHVNIDGISHQIMMQDMTKAYQSQALTPGQEDLLQYPDFSARQHHEWNVLDSAERHQALEFWHREFDTIPEPLPLARSRLSTRLTLTQYAVHSTQIKVNEALATRIRDVSRANKATSFHYYMTAFKILLHRFTGVEDLCVGIADGNRRDQESRAQHSVGLYLNLVPLRFRATPDQTFGISIAETRAKVLGAMAAGAGVPFEMLLNELQVSRSATHSPLFQAFVDYRQGEQERLDLEPGECTMVMDELALGKTAYDVSLDVIDNSGANATVTLMTQASLYSEADTDILAGLFEDILREFVQSPRKRISEDWAYRKDDVERALDLGRGELIPTKWPETILHQIQEVVRQQGPKTALIHVHGDTMTYKQLGGRIDRIAVALMDNGVQQDQFVGVFQESTLDWICSMLAIWKVGAVYVPLDPGVKAERLAIMVKDCSPAAILTDSFMCAKYQELGAPETTKLINVTELAPSTYTTGKAIDILTSKDSLAMVYYTSSSTGVPKGVATKHEGLKAVFEGSSRRYGITTDSVLLLQSSLAFDMTLIQIMLALPVGGTVSMISRDMRGDSVSITEFMVATNVTHTAGTPSEAISWIRFGDRDRLQSSKWRAALCGAEPLAESHLERFRELRKDDLQLFNIYGATETTVYATEGLLDYTDAGLYAERMPAGRSLPNKAIYIVDESMHLLPQGLAGEIVLAGAGVGVGYLHNEATTEASFLPDPHAHPFFIENGWTRMYRTKDRGRLLEDGSVSVEGRMGDDTEIRLRGLRIDLKDIEQTILRTSHGVLAEAVASVRAPAGTETQFLVAHVVFSLDRETEDQRDFLKDLQDNLPLPRYMVPSTIIPIAQMPVTVSGKLDRRAVSALAVSPTANVNGGDTSTTELTAEEAELKSVWDEVLPKQLYMGENISSESDFFHVGGTSLLLVQVQARLKDRFGASIRLADLFARSTIGNMSRLVNSEAKESQRKTIDWEWETRPSPDLKIGTAPSGQHVSPTAHPKVVLLTGCAGFLGRHLLNSLIKHPGVEKIYCVAVRQLHKRIASGLIPSPDPQGRLVYFEGDLRHPRLGLSKADCATVFSTVEGVIHNGADVSHLKSYFTLRAANLNATKELARLCLPRRVPFHYVSTAGVSMFTFWQSFGEETASAAQPPRDGTNGYKASKWASERYLERLNEALRLPTWLHRPSDMVRQDDEEAQWDLPHTLLAYSRRLRAVPLSENLWGWLDLVAVDRVAGDVVQKVVDNKPRVRDGGVSYVHQTGDMAIPIDGMKEFFKEESGGTVVFDKIPIEEWASRAQAAGMYPAVAAVFANVSTLPRALCFPRFVKTWRPAPEDEEPRA